MYIDDRHTGEIQLSPKASGYASLSSDANRSFARACFTIFVVCYTLLDLSYFISLKKSHLVPKQVVAYPGFLVDSVHQAFLLIDEKKQKFLSLLRSVLSSPSTDLKTLQRLSGKCISFSLAVPGARLFLNDIYNVTAKSQRHSSSKPILVTGPLKHELDQWLFL